MSLHAQALLHVRHLCGVWCVWVWNSWRHGSILCFWDVFVLFGVGLWWSRWSCIWFMGLGTLDFSRFFFFVLIHFNWFSFVFDIWFFESSTLDFWDPQKFLLIFFIKVFFSTSEKSELRFLKGEKLEKINVWSMKEYSKFFLTEISQKKKFFCDHFFFFFLIWKSPNFHRI